MEILQDLQEKMLMTLASKCDKTKEAMFYVAANIEFDRDTAYNWIFNKMLNNDISQWTLINSISEGHSSAKRELEKLLFSVDSFSYIVDKAFVVGVCVHFKKWDNSVEFKYKGHELVTFGLKFEAEDGEVAVKVGKIQLPKRYAWETMSEDKLVAIEKTAEVIRKVQEDKVFEGLVEQMDDNFQMYLNIYRFFHYANKLMNEMFYPEKDKKKVYYYLKRARFFAHLEENGSFEAGVKDMKSYRYNKLALNTITFVRIESVDFDKGKMKVVFQQVKGDYFNKELVTKRFENKDMNIFFNQIHERFLQKFKEPLEY